MGGGLGKTGKGENRAKAGPIDEEGALASRERMKRDGRMGNVEVERRWQEGRGG